MSINESMPRRSGSWLDLKVSKQTLRKIKQVAALEELARDKIVTIADLLEQEDFKWPAFEAWRTYFQEAGGLPPEWPEKLANKLRGRANSRYYEVSPKARALLRERGPVSEVFIRERWGWGKGDFKSAVKEISANQLAVRDASAEESLQLLSMVQLRTIQKSFGLKGKRTKSELSILITASVPKKDIRSHLLPAMVIDFPERTEIIEHYDRMKDLAFLLITTLASERHIVDRVKDAKLNSLRLMVSSAGEDAPRICAGADESRYEEGDPVKSLPHFPACRCSLLMDVDHETESRSASANPKKNTSGCVIALVIVVGVACVLLI